MMNQRFQGGGRPGTSGGSGAGWSKTGGGARPAGGASSRAEVLFDPAQPPAALYDELAEKQADAFSGVNSNQLRKFFGDVKDLYRRYTAMVSDKSEAQRDEIYQNHISPLFRMMRSKVAYATRPGGQSQLPGDFADFVSGGVAKVHSAQDFEKFVRHFEAVVGFMYGKEKVKK